MLAENSFCPDATVALEASSYTVLEGINDTLEVCVEITNVPDSGLECDIVVYLSIFDGTASKY